MKQNLMHAILFWAIVILFCPNGMSQGMPAAVIQRLGHVDARTLPPPNHGLGAVYSHAVMLPDAEIFLRDKARSQGGGGGGSSVPPATTAGQGEGLSVGTGSNGLALSDTPGYVPPDSQVAVGENSGTLTTMEMVNGTILVTAGTTSYPLDMCGFFYCDFLTAVISDPIVRYDGSSGRWFASVITIEYVIQGALLKAEGQWRLAVSSSSDPLGGWTVYAATMSDGTFPDFPKMGISSDKVVQTGDSFTISTSRYKGTEFAVLNKQDLLNGFSVPGFQYFAPNQGGFAIESVQTASSDLYMAALGGSGSSNTIRIWKLTGVPTTSGTGVTAAVTNLSVASFVTPPNAPQLGSTQLIDTNGTWLVGAAYDDLSKTMWVSGTSACLPSGDTTTRACLRLVQISLSGAPSALQDITFGKSEEYYYYPAVAYDQSGNLIAVFNGSSATEYVGVLAGGQKQTAGTGTFQTPVTVKAGETAYTISPPRWGDYSGACVDPTVGSPNVWLVGEYSQAITGGGNQWGTWISTAQF